MPKGAEGTVVEDMAGDMVTREDITAGTPAITGDITPIMADTPAIITADIDPIQVTVDMGMADTGDTDTTITGRGIRGT